MKFTLLFKDKQFGHAQLSQFEKTGSYIRRLADPVIRSKNGKQP